MFCCAGGGAEMEIKISSEEILSGDISQIKKVVDDFIVYRQLALENENKIVLKFVGFTTVDLSKKLMEDRYKAWFRKLDAEFPQLPFFLNSASKTLLFFMMGCVDYSINSTSIVFNEPEKIKFTKEKAYRIKNFCFEHDIDPTSAIERLSLSEVSAKKPQTMETYLNKFGAIAFMTRERKVQVSILINEIPSDMKIWGAFFVEKECPQPFFSVFLQFNDDIVEYKAVVLTNAAEIGDYCRQNPAVQTAIIIKTGENYQSYPEIETKIEILTMSGLEEKRKEIFNADIKPQSSTENQPTENQETTENQEETNEASQDADNSLDETLPLADETTDEPSAVAEKTEENETQREEVEEKIPENETPEEKIARLERKIAQLQEKIKQKDNIIEAYEEEINKKRSLKGFFKGFFK